MKYIQMSAYLCEIINKYPLKTVEDNRNWSIHVVDLIKSYKIKISQLFTLMKLSCILCNLVLAAVMGDSISAFLLLLWVILFLTFGCSYG